MLEGAPQGAGHELRCDRMDILQHALCVLTSTFSLQCSDQVILLKPNKRWTGRTEI